MIGTAVNSIDEISVNFDANRWTQLSAIRQRDLLRRLEAIRDELLAASVMDSADTDGYRGRQSGSRQSMIWLTVFGFIFAATLLTLIR